jgi:hypothetical protein
MTLGVFYTCFNENRAVEYSLSCLYSVYPNIKTFLISDGGNDFSYLEKNYPTLKTNLENDTLSFNKEITNKNFLENKFQEQIKNSAASTISRLEQCINYCNTEYILMMDPDTIVRGKLNIPKQSRLLGSRVNIGFPEQTKKILKSIDNAKVIDCWGATPAIFHSDTFLKGINVLKTNPALLDEFCKSFYAIFAHDVLLPIIFALVGEEEMFNPDITECSRDARWRYNNKPLVHQYKFLY